MNGDAKSGGADSQVVQMNLTRTERGITFVPNGSLVGTRARKIADGVAADENPWGIALQSDGVYPPTAHQGVNGVVKDLEAGCSGHNIGNRHAIGSSGRARDI